MNRKKIALDRLESMDRMDFLRLALKSVPDRDFLEDLQQQRGRGRNDYPIDLLWRSVLASIACKASSIEQMRRSMGDHLELFAKVPSASAFSRFFQILSERSEEIEALGFRAIEEQNPDAGCAIGIGDIERIVFLWQPQTGIPFLFEPMGEKDSKVAAAERLLERIRVAGGEAWNRCKYAIAGEEYEPLAPIMWSRYRLRAIIPLPSSKDFQLQPFANAYYDRQGMFYCSADPLRSLVFAGFEENREALKYRCMMRHYDVRCASYEECPLRSGIRVPLELDPSVFMPVPRGCCRWGQLFQLHSSLPLAQTALKTYLQIGKDREKKLLSCRIAAILLLAASAGNSAHAKRVE